MSPDTRAALLADLESRAHGAWQTTGTVGLLLGEPGMGKTRIAGDLLKRLPHSTAILKTAALPAGSPPLLPISEALTGAYRFSDEIADLLEEYAGAIPVLRTVLAPFLRAHRKIRRGRALSRDVAPSETFAFATLLSVLERLSKHRHIAFFVDDVQWLDASSLSFLGYLAQKTPLLRAFVLLSARANGAVPDGLEGLVTTLDRLPESSSIQLRIPPLSTAEIPTMAEEVLGGPVRFGSEELCWLQQCTRGNPHYVAEVLRLLREAGTLVCRQGGWGLAATPSAMFVPPSFAQAARERLAKVDSHGGLTLRAVHYAALLGREADARVLARLLETTPGRVVAALSAVAHATGYVVEGAHPRMFHFNHELTREAVLQGLGSAAPALHLEVARVLEVMPRASASEIAWHYRAAGRPRSAARFYETAYRWSLKRSAYNDAAAAALRCDQCLDLAGHSPTDALRLGVLEDRIEALLGAEQYRQAAEATYDRIEAAVATRRVRLPLLLGRAQARLAEHHAHESAKRWLRTALEFARHHGDKEQEALAWTHLVYVYDALGETAQSASAFRAALGLAREVSLVPLTVRLLRMTCIFFQPEMARGYLTEALHLASQHRLQYERGLCLNNLGTADLHLGDLERAKRHFTAARRLMESLGGFRSDFPLNNLGLVALLEGRLDEGRTFLEEAVLRANDADALLFIRSNLALAEALRGRLTIALELWRALVPTADATGDLFYSDCLRHNAAQALVLQGDGPGACRMAEGCLPHHAGGDEVLVCGKRAELLLRALGVGADLEDVTRQQAAAVALATSTKPQAWLYRLPWYYCDIEFWED